MLESSMERSYPAMPLSIEVQLRAVLFIAATSASLYTLDRAKAEAAHVHAELSYTRLLMRLDTIDDSLQGSRQAMLDQIGEAFKDLAAAKADALLTTSRYVRWKHFIPPRQPSGLRRAD